MNRKLLTTAMKKDSLIAQIDWLTVGMFLLLMLCGWLSVCGAGYGFEDSDLVDFSLRSGKQLIWIACAIVIAAVLMTMNQNFLRSYSYAVYVLIMALLLLTIFIAKDHKGSHSWIDIGPVSLQPAEFAKFATALALARYMDNYSFNPQNLRSVVRGVFFFLLPMALIVAQQETGSALVYVVFFLVMFREGINGLPLFFAFCAVLFFVIGIKFWNVPFGFMPFTVGPFTVLLLIQIFTSLMLLIYVENRHLAGMTFLMGFAVSLVGLIVCLLVYPFNLIWLQVISLVVISVYLVLQAMKNVIRPCLVVAAFTVLSTVYLFSCNFVLNSVLQPHQRTRINIVLGVEEDPFGAGYNVNQSKIAIGSGGFMGKGFLNGTQTKLKYVPEQDTDFIFCTVGEEQGFVGSAAVLILYAAFILRLFVLAERQSSVFGRAFGYSVGCIFLFHVFINVGMVLGITPVIGIPLPFFSYGGSSLWSFTILLFIFLRIDAERTSRF